MNLELKKNRLIDVSQPYDWNLRFANELLNNIQENPLINLSKLILLQKWENEQNLDSNFSDIFFRAMNQLHLHLNIFDSLQLKVLKAWEEDTNYRSIKKMFETEKFVQDLETAIEDTKHFSSKKISIKFFETDFWGYISIFQTSKPQEK